MIAVWISACSLAVSGVSLIVTGNTAAMMGDRRIAAALRSAGVLAIAAAPVALWLAYAAGGA